MPSPTHAAISNGCAAAKAARSARVLMGKATPALTTKAERRIEEPTIPRKPATTGKGTYCTMSAARAQPMSR
jgi:hypothetical protein